MWKLNKEVVDPKSLGRILVPQHGLFEGCIEWANGSPLQKIQRQLLGVHHDEPMSERLLPKPLSPNAYKKDTDGPKLHARLRRLHPRRRRQRGVRALLEGRQKGGQRPGDDCHPGNRRLRRDGPPGDRAWVQLVRELADRTIHDPKLNVIGYVTDKRAREADVISDDDIITRPTASRAKLRRETKEAPAL